MSSWADQSDPSYNEPWSAASSSYQEQDSRGSTHAAPSQRKRLQLKPRSTKKPSESSGTSAASSSSPFGAAKPREEVLAQKGIDPKLVDERIQKKATPLRFTKEQEEELEILRAGLTKVEEELRDANERELPEEKFRVETERRRKELNEVMKNFQELNLQTQQEQLAEKANKPRQKFERPSERRRRLEQEGGGGGHHHHDDHNQHHHHGERRHNEHGGERRHNEHGERSHNEHRGGSSNDPYSSFGGRHHSNKGEGF